jgi:hypothetical protein
MGDAIDAVTYNGAMTRARLTPALVVVVGVLLAGCGGGNSDQRANLAYANGVCTTIGNWLTEVKSINTLPPLAEITKASIIAKLNHFEKATRRFVSQIKAVPAPNTAEGRAAKRKIDQSPLIPSAQTEIDSAELVASTVASAGSPTDVLDALFELPNFRTLKTTAQSTLTYLRTGGGPLASAFKSEPACKRLG